MVVGAKKRRKSRSPDRGASSKRARVPSASISVRSQQSGRDAPSARDGSARSLYCPQKQERAQSLPTGADWVFRVKVISSSTDLGDDVFKDAVQGLVKICFPEGILDQLGIEVLHQHMRQEKAPEENIERMLETFRTEMTQRVTWMLAEYLDTPAKVASAMRATIEASATLHGEALGDDILSEVNNSLFRLKERAPERSTEWLANGDVRHDTYGSDEATESDEASGREEPVLPPKAKKEKKRDKQNKRNSENIQEDVFVDAEMDVGMPKHTPTKVLRPPKDNKISSKWRWDVDPANLTDEAVSEAFSHTSDLFAYHALPIARRRLGPQALKKEIRYDMQSLLDEMPADEFEKWVESLQKLHNGDREMLVRPELAPSNDEQRLSRATPAPVDMRKRAKKAAKNAAGTPSLSGRRVESASIASNQKTIIKREPGTISSVTTPRSREDASAKRVVEATAALRHVLTEECDFRTPVQSVEGATEGNTRDVSSIVTAGSTVDLDYDKPILSLLWGSGNFTPDERASITQTIMDNLQRRVSAERIGVKGLGGANKTCTRSELKAAITNVFATARRPFHFMRLRKDVETLFIPWVIAEVGAFPELKAMPFIFAHTMPFVLATLNALFGPWSAISRMSGPQMWDGILQALQRRGISEASMSAANIDCLQIDSLCNDRKHPHTTRRALLERVLRRLAFSHRDRFQDLKTSPVVTTWERMTGLTW